MNKKKISKPSLYILLLTVAITIVFLIAGFRPQPLESIDSVDKALTCNKRICPIPDTNLCCNSTLMPGKAFYCDIDNIVECE